MLGKGGWRERGGGAWFVRGEEGEGKGREGKDVRGEGDEGNGCI